MNRVKIKSLRGSKICAFQITSRILPKCHFFTKSLFLEKNQISNEDTCQGDSLMYQKNCSIGYLPRYGKNSVYFGISMLPSWQSRIIASQFWTHFLWTCEASKISLMGPHVAKTVKRTYRGRSMGANVMRKHLNLFAFGAGDSISKNGHITWTTQQFSKFQNVCTIRSARTIS